MTVRRLAVVTGDHGAPDPTKRGGRYNAEDLRPHGTMVAAFAAMRRFDVTVIADHGHLFQRLASERPDLVVNFCDTGVGNRPELELNLPAWLELQGIPYTGAPPGAIALCYDKQAVRLVAQALGVEVPREAFVAAGGPPDPLPDLYPALIKPNRADGSVGITRDSVVHDRPQAEACLARLRAGLPGADALWQEYLPGPEYSLGLIGNPGDTLVALPPLEADFSRLPAGWPPLLGYESKAHPESPYWTDVAFHEARLDAATRERLEAWTRRLFVRLGLRDYARLDFRAGADGRPRLLEVNPNPAWADDAKLALMAGFAGIPYARMLEMIVEAAIARIAGGRG